MLQPALGGASLVTKRPERMMAELLDELAPELGHEPAPRTS